MPGVDARLFSETCFLVLLHRQQRLSASVVSVARGAEHAPRTLCESGLSDPLREEVKLGFSAAFVKKWLSIWPNSVPFVLEVFQSYRNCDFCRVRF